jgi:GGDEF domain-containing protein
MSTLDLKQLNTLERREFQLSILAAIIVLVMAGGVALLMYPLVFVHPEESNKWTMRFAFIGFCVLSLLFVAYLLDRQRTVRGLKQQLVDELRRNLELRHQANVDLLHSLPNMEHFQDRLTMEYRRAANMQRPLSLLVVRLKLLAGITNSKEETAALGEVARAMSRHLRPTDSMYVFGQGLFGLVLPDTDTSAANHITLQIEDSLRAQSGGNRFSFATFVCNYPDHAKSAHELEQTVASLLPERQSWAEEVAKQ